VAAYSQANHSTSAGAHDGDICAFPRLDPIVPAASLLKLALVNVCCCDRSCLDCSIQYHFLASGKCIASTCELMYIEHAYPGLGNKIDQSPAQNAVSIVRCSSWTMRIELKLGPSTCVAANVCDSHVYDR
jgi:hypothetical protein